MKLLRLILLLLLTTILPSMADGHTTITTDGSPKSIGHSLSVELRPAYNMMSHGYLNGRNPDNKVLNKAAALHLRYSFSFTPESPLGKLYPASYQGIGFAAYTFFGHASVGTPLAVYLFQGARIADIEGGPSVGYEWNLGWSWGWRPNDAMNSKWNVLINVGMPISWRLDKGWEVSLVPDFTHFSNGDTSFPNSGTNTFGVRLGTAKTFGHQHADVRAQRYIEPSTELGPNNKENRLVWDLVLYGGWRGDRFFSNDRFCVIDKPLPNGGLQIAPLYRLNRYFSVGGAIDMLVDTSANLYDAQWNEDSGELISYSRPSLWQQSSIGVSVRGELTMSIFTAGVGAGMNIITHGYDMRRYYTNFGLKAFVSERAFLYIGYRLSSLQFTHNIMYGVGVRF